MKKIVLTGGPCGGKSTIIKNLKSRLEKDGYKVFIVDETARNIIAGGIKANNDREYTKKFQESILKLQVLKEDIFENFADDNTIILYDRAIIDNKAYFDYEEDYYELLNKNNLDELNILDKYDLVLNLVSLSAYKLNNYEYKNDEERAEDNEFAQVLEKRTQNAWRYHKNYKIILPEENIKDKEENIYLEIQRMLNNIKSKKKVYSVKSFDNNDLDYMTIHEWIIRNEFSTVSLINKYMHNYMFQHILYKRKDLEVEFKDDLESQYYLFNIADEVFYKQYKFIENFNLYTVNVYTDGEIELIMDENIEKLPNNVIIEKEKIKKIM